MSAAELKAQGNSAFSAKEYAQAADLFGQAITASGDAPETYVLYSNRSGAYAALKDYKSALADADKCISLKPDWAKGYNRRAAALHGLGQLSEAVRVYDRALEIDPSNAQAKQGKKSAEDAMAANDNPMSNFAAMLKEPAMVERLKNDPRTKKHFSDPNFMQAIEKFMADPLNALSGAGDPRMMDVLSVALGGNESEFPAEPTTKKPKAEEPKAEEPKVKAAASEPETKNEAQAAADAEKQQGNALYKQRQFDEAISHYDKAYELYKDITYLNNRAAAEFEKGDYDAAIKTGLLAVEESHEVRSDYKAVAKALARIGSSYLKLDNLKEAIEYFEKSLTEQRSPDVLTKLRSTQRELRVREEQAYLDPKKSEEAREEGNRLFKEGRFPESVKAYTEAIKRNPKEPKGYSNRAASYLKLMNYPDVVRDCDKAIELEPNFIKAYTRKATACNIMKQHRKAMDTLETAREVDKDGKHSREIEDLYYKASQARFAALPGETEDQRTERLTADPEIDEIRRDPVMNTILQQAASDPAALRDHMKNPEVRRKINLLAAAGIIRTR